MDFAAFCGIVNPRLSPRNKIAQLNTWYNKGPPRFPNRSIDLLAKTVALVEHHVIAGTLDPEWAGIVELFRSEEQIHALFDVVFSDASMALCLGHLNAHKVGCTPAQLVEICRTHEEPTERPILVLAALAYQSPASVMEFRLIEEQSREERLRICRDFQRNGQREVRSRWLQIALRYYRRDPFTETMLYNKTNEEQLAEEQERLADEAELAREEQAATEREVAH